MKKHWIFAIVPTSNLREIQTPSWFHGKNSAPMHDNSLQNWSWFHEKMGFLQQFQIDTKLTELIWRKRSNSKNSFEYGWGLISQKKSEKKKLKSSPILVSLK